MERASDWTWIGRRRWLAFKRRTRLVRRKNDDGCLHKDPKALLRLDVKCASSLSSLEAVKGGEGGRTFTRRHLPDPVVRVTRQHGWTSNTRRAGEGIASAVPRSGSFFQRPSTLSLAFRVSLPTRINADLLTTACSVTLRLGRRQCVDTHR